MSEPDVPATRLRVWTVGSLCRAISESVAARFNPVEVQGEISGFARVASGHCYFVLKDEAGQLRCAMFRRAAMLLDFAPKDGESVLVSARLGVYEPRGDLQLVVETMSRAGQGALFEQFLKLKVKLAAEGLFDAARKRPIPVLPRGIGLVTSLGGAALHDIVTLLRRRAPHVPLVIAPALVQGAGAAQEMIQALVGLNEWAQRRSVDSGIGGPAPIEVILLARGGGSMDDLWAFNDEALARAIAASALPVVSGVGHETDFTIADFVADLRAPTPTAAAELAAQPLQVARDGLDRSALSLQQRVRSELERAGQTLDFLASRLARPSALLLRQRMLLFERGQRLLDLARAQRRAGEVRLANLGGGLQTAVRTCLTRSGDRLERCQLRLELMNPRQVLRRGFVWVNSPDGRAVTRVAEIDRKLPLTLQFADGQADVSVNDVRPE